MLTKALFFFFTSQLLLITRSLSPGDLLGELGSSMEAYFSSPSPSVPLAILQITSNLLKLGKLKMDCLYFLLPKNLRVETLLCPRPSEMCHFNSLVCITSERLYCWADLPQRHRKCCLKHSHTFFAADEPLVS